MTRALFIATAVLGVGLCLIYLPDIGHGFVRDDFRWIAVGRLESLGDIPALLTADVGFYRPLVLASFGVNYALFGLHAFPFALTNLLLLVFCAALIARLASTLGLAPTSSALAAAAWAFNFRAVGMALLWISGRTALFLTLFALLATLATLRQRRWRAAGWCLLALLSKEEAAVLPFFLAAWVAWSASADIRWRETLRQSGPMVVALGVYVVLRSNSHAFGPFTAPSYYQFTIEPAHLLRNAVEYLDRSSTFAAALAALLLITCRQLPSFDQHHRRALTFSLAWLLSGFALTVFLPLRSDLYALAPSAGSCLALGVVADALERQQMARVRRALAVLVLLPFVLLPVYRARGARWVRPADLSAQVLRDLHDAARIAPLGRYVALIDAPSERTTLDSAFQSLIPDAGRLIGAGRVEIVAEGEVPADATDVFRLSEGRLIRASR